MSIILRAKIILFGSESGPWAAASPTSNSIRSQRQQGQGYPLCWSFLWTSRLRTSTNKGISLLSNKNKTLYHGDICWPRSYATPEPRVAYVRTCVQCSYGISHPIITAGISRFFSPQAPSVRPLHRPMATRRLPMTVPDYRLTPLQRL